MTDYIELNIFISITIYVIIFYLNNNDNYLKKKYKFLFYLKYRNHILISIMVTSSLHNKRKSTDGIPKWRRNFICIVVVFYLRWYSTQRNFQYYLLYSILRRNTSSMQ